MSLSIFSFVILLLLAVAGSTWIAIFAVRGYFTITTRKSKKIEEADKVCDPYR